MVVLLESFRVSIEELLNSVSDHRVLGHLPDQDSSPQFLIMAGHLALGRVLVVPNFFHLRMMEATMFLGTCAAEEHFLVPFPRSVPRHNAVLELYRLFRRPHGLVFAHAL